MIGDRIHIEGLPRGTVIREDAEGHAWAWFRPGVSRGVLVERNGDGSWPPYRPLETRACHHRSVASDTASPPPSSP